MAANARYADHQGVRHQGTGSGSQATVEVRDPSPYA
jgi:hypothetical protein